MATAQDYIEFAAERLAPCGDIRYKEMFGEYMVYVNEKPLVLVCDGVAYVKMLPCLDGLLSGRGCPYDGAKEHYILDIEDSELTEKVIALLNEHTPMPGPKAKKRKPAQAADPIGDYIASRDESIQPRLREIYRTIKAVLPDAVEKISWQMPTFWKGQNLIHFAAAKKHIGLYPGSEAVEIFASKLTEYKTSKGAIQLPNNKPLPIELITEIAELCGRNNAK
jgi:uncharacterized protein YdhG (YjbR/CyaY superfamily)/TfoX/Sxy family transcriptional regulator of competence genes